MSVGREEYFSAKVCIRRKKRLKAEKAGNE